MGHVVVGHFTTIASPAKSVPPDVHQRPRSPATQFAPATMAAPARTRIIDHSIVVADIVDFARETCPYLTEESDGPGRDHREHGDVSQMGGRELMHHWDVGVDGRRVVLA